MRLIQPSDGAAKAPRRGSLLPLPEHNRYTRFIAWSPALQVLLHWGLLALGIPLAWRTIGVVALLWIPLAVLAASLDGAALRAAGAPTTAPPWLVALTPITYFVARGRTHREQTFNPDAPLGSHAVAVCVTVLLCGFASVTAAFGLRTGTLGY